MEKNSKANYMYLYIKLYVYDMLDYKVWYNKFYLGHYLTSANPFLNKLVSRLLSQIILLQVPGIILQSSLDVLHGALVDTKILRCSLLFITWNSIYISY